MIRLAAAILLAILLLTVGLSGQISQQGVAIRFPQQVQKPFCAEVFSREEMRRENSTYLEIAESLRWVDINTTHFVRSIITFVNNDRTALLEIVSDSASAALSYASPFLALVCLFLAIAAYWLYWLCGWGSERTGERARKQRKGLAVRDKVGLVGLAVSVVLVCALCLRGMGQAQMIRRTVNTVSCTLMNQNNIGFVRNGDTMTGGPLDFAEQVEKFQRYSSEAFNHFKALFKNRQLEELSQKSGEAVSVWQGAHRGSSGEFLRSMNSTATKIKHVVSVLREMPGKIRTYNDTLEYVRQVMFAFRLIIGNFDKFFSRYVGFDSLASFLSRLTVLSLVLVMVLVVGSGGAVIWVSLAQKHEHAHCRQGGQYLLGLCLVLCLGGAVGSSVLVPFLHANRDYIHYLVAAPENMKEQFRVGRYINRYLQEIITHFFPNAEGSAWHYYEGKLLADLEYLHHELSVISLQRLQELDRQAQLELASPQSPEGRLVAELAEVVDSKTFERVRRAQSTLQRLIFEMRDESGLLGRVETRSLGRNVIYPALVYLHRFGTNRLYEMRQIYGGCCLGLLLALACTCGVQQVQRAYIKISKIAQMTEVELEEQQVKPVALADDEHDNLERQGPEP